MPDFFNSIPEAIYPIASDYAKILIPSLITYFATRYSLTRPYKYKIKEKQFDLVYLPLYLLTTQYISKPKEQVITNISIYIKKVDKLIYKNYPFVNPKTLKPYEALKIEISKSNFNFYFISNFEYQVITDYNILKKELGYPSDNIINFIKQLNYLDRLLFFANLAFIGLALISITTLILCIYEGQLLQSFGPLFSFGISVFMLYLLHYITRH